MRAPLAALIAGLALGAAPAAAELIEYRLPDGSTGYTNEPARVPPGAEILSSREASPASEAPPPAAEAAAPPPPPAAAKPRPAPAPADAEPQPSEEAYWRQRVRDAQRAAVEARIRFAESQRLFNDCRGRENYWNSRYGYDSSRYRHPGEDSSCEDEAANLEAAREHLAEAESYVADGLFEDCRRSGCLPGWLR